MTKESRYERLEDLQARERQLSQEIADCQKMIDAVDGARNRMEFGLNELNHSSEEMKGQIRILKERQRWLIGQQDELRGKIAKMTHPGDSR